MKSINKKSFWSFLFIITTSVLTLTGCKTSEDGDDSIFNTDTSALVSILNEGTYTNSTYGDSYIITKEGSTYTIAGTYSSEASVKGYLKLTINDEDIYLLVLQNSTHVNYVSASGETGCYGDITGEESSSSYGITNTHANCYSLEYVKAVINGYLLSSMYVGGYACASSINELEELWNTEGGTDKIDTWFSSKPEYTGATTE